MTLAQPIEMSTFLYERLRMGHATPGCKQNLTASPNFPARRYRKRLQIQTIYQCIVAIVPAS